MNKIVFPLTSGMQGLDVADLQAALRLLLVHAALLGDDEGQRLELVTALEREQSEQTYGEVTGRVVGVFQSIHRIGEGLGEVDESTATALNNALSHLGAFATELLVSGRVLAGDRSPLQNVIVRAFHEDERASIRLGEDTTDAEGRYTIRYQPLPGVDAIRLRVGVLRRDGTPVTSSEPFPATALEIIDLTVPLVIEREGRRRIEGRVVYENGLPAGELVLRLYRHAFGDSEPEMLEESSVGDEGLYVLEYDPDERSNSFEIRALDSTGGEVALTHVMHGIGDRPVVYLNLAAPTSMKPLSSEFERMSAALAPHVGDMQKLREAQENEDRQDFTLLNASTGWDARLIALAAKAAKVSEQPDIGVSQGVLYGLFRAGLPSDARQLAAVPEPVVEQALATAAESGIISLSEAERDAAQAAIKDLQRNAYMATPVPGLRASYDAMLTAANLNEPARKSFLELYMKHDGTAEELWSAAKAAGIADADIQRLQTQGKLAFLTHSEPLMRRLQDGLGIQDPADLVSKGFYESSRWRSEIEGIAAGDADRLKELIPPSYTAEDIEENLELYSQDMARQLRLSYPTQILAHRIEKDPDKFALAASTESVVSLLKNAAARGFRLGETPFSSFARKHPGTLASVEGDKAAAQQSVETLQRIYQMTPSDSAMLSLMRLGFTSALDVVKLTEDEFLDRHGEEFSSEDEARLIYRKAQQVSSVCYNLFTIARKIETDPPLYGMSAPEAVRKEVRSELIKQFPTLESLFGSMDYCECEHCNSVLSPAAYFVDLLQFIDSDPPVWNSFLSDWKKRRGADYTDTYKKPYDALIERRPDLPHIALSCENTHTAMPYIDIVNEVLEYYVAYETLAASAARDTGDASTAELLAEPQYVISKAYEKLLLAHYPLALPFDLWLETVRAFCRYFETPLAEVLEVFRPADDLFAPTVAYDRAAIAYESLGLSATEAKLFTNPKPLETWFELYGVKKPAGLASDVVDEATGEELALDSAKTLARRLGVTYKELVELLQTSFVNPGVENLTLLRKLGVTIEQFVFYREHRAFYEANKHLIGADRAALSEADRARYDELRSGDWDRLSEIDGFERRLETFTARYPEAGIDARQWLLDQLEANAFDDVLVLADPQASVDLDFARLQYGFRASPADRRADALALLRINLFVRLWRKLGWTIDETDRALAAFIPKKVPFDADHLRQAPLRSALIHLARFKALDERLGLGRQGRIKLLTLWAPISTEGKIPLYVQLFLQPGVLKADAVFDDPLGRYLHPDAVAAAASSRVHHVVLSVKPADAVDPAPLAPYSAAFSVEYDELQEMQHFRFKGVMTDADKAELLPLSDSSAWPTLLEAMQARGRAFGLLKGHLPAMQSALSVTSDDVNRILEHAGVDIETAALTLETVSLLYRYSLLARALQLPVRDLIALLELSGLSPFRLVHEEVLEELEQDNLYTQTLELVRIKADLDSAGFTISALDYLLRHIDESGTEAASAASTDALLAALKEGIETIRAELAPPADAASITDEQLGQRLGQALPPEKAAETLRLLDGRSEASARILFDEYLRKRPSTTGFLADDDFEPLFAPLKPHVEIAASDAEDVRRQKEEQNDEIDAENQTTLQNRRLRLAAALLETLAQRRIRQFILETLTAHTRAERPIVEALVTDANLLSVGEGGTRTPLIEGFEGERAAEALLRLTKALRIVQTAGLTKAEMKYLLTPGGVFDGLDLSALPFAPGGDGRKSFEKVLRLVTYIRLKRGLARGTDTLVEFLESAPTEDAAYGGLAAITRRDAATIKAVAKALKLGPPFNDVRALSRLAAGLAMTDRFGLPVGALLACTEIVSGKGTSDERMALARDLKSAVKARFEPDAWQRTAQPIFDSLRRHQRDALVAYVMQKHGFDRIEQLYDYFLIDPGMEPVVQTSRIRLATASVQLFIQRCLLNLEKFVHPSAINSAHWRWMKAYRVWEANRKIFLFPENWLEPEFRDDKTHLFRELEGALLQGDVTDDLIEDAMFDYLRKLNELARLDIVALHLEEKIDPARNTLHVIARTHGEPHKYFYRRYAHEVWTPWEPVSADITGDHLAPVIWKDRLFLFWVTFMEVPPRSAPPSSDGDDRELHASAWDLQHGLSSRQIELASMATTTSGGTGGKSDGKKSTLTELSLADLSRGVRSSVPSSVRIQIQLHWSEYVRGEWSTRETGGMAASFVRDVPFGFHPGAVSIHVAKATTAEGDGPVYVHLGAPIGSAFMLAGRNSTPQVKYSASPPGNPYSANDRRATRLYGSGSLSVSFAGSITAEDGKPSTSTPVTRTLLEAPEGFTLLVCNNEIDFATPEISALIKPLFYQDSRYTYFIEPSLEERTLHEVKEWMVRTPQPQPGGELPEGWGIKPYIPPKYYKPKLVDPLGPIWQGPIDDYSRYRVNPGVDWMINPGTGLLFDGQVIGPTGRAPLEVIPKADVPLALEQGASPVAVQPGVDLPFDVSVLDVDRAGTRRGGSLVGMNGRVTIVGGLGLDQTVTQNVRQLTGGLVQGQRLVGGVGALRRPINH